MNHEVLVTLEVLRVTGKSISDPLNSLATGRAPVTVRWFDPPYRSIPGPDASSLRFGA